MNWRSALLGGLETGSNIAQAGMIKRKMDMDAARLAEEQKYKRDTLLATLRRIQLAEDESKKQKLSPYEFGTAETGIHYGMFNPETGARQEQGTLPGIPKPPEKTERPPSRSEVEGASLLEQFKKPGFAEKYFVPEKTSATPAQKFKEGLVETNATTVDSLRASNAQLDSMVQTVYPQMFAPPSQGMVGHVGQRELFPMFRPPQGQAVDPETEYNSLLQKAKITMNPQDYQEYKAYLDKEYGIAP